MTFFFDRCIPPNLPKALKRLRPPVEILLHDDRFPRDAADDVWLPVVGSNGWIVLTHDYHFHQRANERAAIKQYNVGCFYLWGASAPIWEVATSFMRSYDRIVTAAAETPRPFVYRVGRRGELKQETLD